MFTSCDKITSLDLSSFVSKEATNMLNMFYDCRKLAYLDI